MRVPGLTGYGGLGPPCLLRPEPVLRPGPSTNSNASTPGRVGSPRAGPGLNHSCAEIVVCDTLIDTSALPRALAFERPTRRWSRTANVTLDDFLTELARRGTSVTAIGGTNHRTLAGLISTGHGAGLLPPSALRATELGRTCRRCTLRRGALRSGASRERIPTSHR